MAPLPPDPQTHVGVLSLPVHGQLGGHRQFRDFAKAKEHRTGDLILIKDDASKHKENSLHSGLH
jgi:hypothetical protein